MTADDTKSLFIISLPRSLSTHVHQMCCDALGLQSPSWTSAGEIMNLDRSVLFLGRGPGGLKYITPQHGNIFSPAKDYLSQVVHCNGFAYKDVVQPFVVAQWLRESPKTQVLKILPNIAHVAFAMMSKNWLYPTVAGGEQTGTSASMICGLLRATHALESVPGEAVSYDDLIYGVEPLRRALHRLYPGRPIPHMSLGSGFEKYRDEILHRRRQDDFLELQNLEREIRGAANLTA